ncbi:hybrid sensor histidine kinase/response regulator transcription factor [Marinicella marina]|nr:ATP-binding protein [Marinicella marina]MDJ1138656.1 ATP-binding protein [Marinicella marina]
MWVATDSGVFLMEYGQKQLSPFQPGLIPSIIVSIESDQSDIWFASATTGLFQYRKKTGQIYQHQKSLDQNSIPENELTSLFKDEIGQIWISTFTGLLAKFNPTFPKLKQNLNCDTTAAIYEVIEFENKLFIAAEDGIAIASTDLNTCHFIPTKPTAFDDEGFVPTSFFVDSQENFWIGSEVGLHQLDYDGKTIKSNIKAKELSGVSTILGQVDEEHLLIASGFELYLFEILTKNFIELKIISTKENNLNKIKHNGSIKFKDHFFLASNHGILIFNTKSKKLVLADLINSQLPTQQTTAISYNNDSIYIGTMNYGLFEHDTINQITKQLIPESILPSEINNVVADNNGNVWLSSNIGLIKYNHISQAASLFNANNGVPKFKAVSKSSFIDSKQNIYIGTRDGLLKFSSNLSENSNNILKPVLTHLKRFNEQVKIGQSYDGFEINKDINLLEKLELSHLDYVTSFNFSATSNTDPENTTYSYQLQGFDPDWNTVGSDNRFATYTNLPSGDYELKIRAAHLDGGFSQKIKTLSIQVLPPPWLTWWAISAYVLLALFSIYWYVQRKIKTNKAIAEQLRLEVAEKTKELNIQKQTVESLLVKKNELFSNVSHEFRTPLTLILGPIKELINKQVDQEDTRSLKMINRSANRLLSLVEQLLQIARVSDTEQVNTTPQNTQNQVASLVESFQYLADSKHIKLDLKHNDQATIDVTDQFIDAVLGNLVSNAIKYTQSGGHVEVTSKTTDDSLVLSVSDNGAGLTAEQQKDIFKRFRRLDSHQAIEGIGIGLSVVEEVVKVNNGEIQVSSELGVGSEFIVRIPLAEAVAEIESSHISTLIEQLQNESIEAKDESTVAVNNVENRDLNTVLVIEDNHDMREHIVSIVSPFYNCITAENGVKGVATAIEQVPDIIISDVMMPEMDGFKVARVIRADQRTSHIPLMLLTALNDKVSRIKGWRENVDAYMAKPFDRDELLVQLENMLTIRDILKTKAGQEVKSGKSTSKVLPKKDQEFVDQLIQVIEENYMDPILNRAKIASKMAVSDRQLQRKIKALIDQNPMDMLREYRLNKSKELLKDGYQVGIVADNCGFNSVSYFSQCFKAQFGMTAKTYQQTAK